MIPSQAGRCFFTWTVYICHLRGRQYRALGQCIPTNTPLIWLENTYSGTQKLINKVLGQLLHTLLDMVTLGTKWSSVLFFQLTDTPLANIISCGFWAAKQILLLKWKPLNIRKRRNFEGNQPEDAGLGYQILEIVKFAAVGSLTCIWVAQ